MKYVLEKPIKATNLEPAHKTSIQWRNGVLIADEPLKLGGQDLGPDPYTLLLSSLVACTIATLRLYIAHKGLTISRIDVEANIAYQMINEETIAVIERKISFDTNLEPDMQQRLLNVAERCPISKLLKGDIQITTELVK